MRNKLVAVGIALAALVLVVHQARSGDEMAAPGQQPSADEMQAMMQQWQKLMTPGAAHERLKPMVGTWNVATKTWWGGPGSPVAESKGTCENAWVLGGRFVQSHLKGEVMMPGADGAMQAMPFEGIGTLGYDNFRNQYQGTWMDSMGTTLLHYSGASDPAGKVFTFYGEMDEPTMQVIGRQVKYVTRVLGPDKHVFEMYDLHAGDDYKVMEITYTRSK